ncbi:MAG: hypothetical protein WBS14_19980 [Rhodomicrobium sp.]
MLASIKDKPFGRPPKRPSLTAAALDGSAYVLIGAEECSRRGSN